MDDLIKRLEAATGPSRELDVDVHDAVGKCAHRETRYYYVEDGNSVDSGHSCTKCGEDVPSRQSEIPRYTASIDAALTLMPEGWHVSTFSTGDPSRSSLEMRGAYVCLRPNSNNDAAWLIGEQSGHHPTNAIALTIAALKARL